MYDILWTDQPYGILTLIVITMIMGGAGAWATGRAMAKTWRPLAMLLPYMILLTAGVRFLHFALYQEPLLSPSLFLVAFVWTLIVGVLGYRSQRAKQMATQYSWAFERAGFNWRPKGGGTPP